MHGNQKLWNTCVSHTFDICWHFFGWPIEEFLTYNKPAINGGYTLQYSLYSRLALDKFGLSNLFPNTFCASIWLWPVSKYHKTQSITRHTYVLLYSVYFIHFNLPLKFFKWKFHNFNFFSLRNTLSLMLNYCILNALKLFSTKIQS